MLTRQIYDHARRNPDKIALVFNNRTLTYHELASSIEASRRLLEKRGVAGQGVAFVVISSFLDAWIVGLAVRGLGMTTLVLPSLEEASKFDFPGIRFVVARTGDRAWPGLQALCRARGWEAIDLPAPRFTRARKHGAVDAPVWPAVPGERILLTSGTTGLSKMTLFDPLGENTEPHRRAIFEISDRSVVLVPSFGGWSSAGYNVPAHVWDAGGTVSIYQGSRQWESFRRPGVTHAFVHPALLAKVLSAPRGELPRNDEIQLIVTGGALLPEQYAEAKARLTHQIFVCVGATEAGVFTLTRVEQPDDLRWHRIVPGCDVQVVGDDGRSVPVGEVGMVRVRVSDGASGYLHDEAASRDFFHEGYFYTGDLGVFRGDGRLSLHGRSVDVLNVAGEKILPAPIEEKLASECGVSGACVFQARPEEDGHTVYVVLESPPTISLPKVEAALASVLPRPFSAKIHCLGVLPRNHMGKILREDLKRRIGL